MSPDPGTMRMTSVFPLILAVMVGSLGGWAVARPTVAVPDFKNEVANVPWWSASVSTQLADALASELAASGGLQVVERQNVQAVLSEQEMAELGITRPTEGNFGGGRMTRAQYLVLGRVSGYEAGVETRENENSMSFLGFGNREGVAEAKAYVAIDLRIVDSATGSILGSTTVEGTATNTAQVHQQGGSLEPLATVIGDTIGDERGAGALLLGVAKTFNYSEGSSESRKVPAAQAIRAALVAGSDYVDCVLVQLGGRCLNEYAARDAVRRRSTQGILNLD
ncbi:MAG: penicillin-binding protein activator LpoB [Synechococcus sp. SB0669_bin_7]|nr:penicillin-binding protein activator LpoB [Synechococcus sp. SB0675_bin_7]MYK86117.1 penicillin-binding protein activator LpoB [Synechococcus sp. SB0669_bin_7]